MDRAGHDERAAAAPPFDEKRDAPSSLSSASIPSEERDVGAETRVDGAEKAQEVTEGDERGGDADEAAAATDGKEHEKLSLQRSKSVTNAASIPDGGLWAWLQVLGGFFLLFNSWYATPHLPSCRASNAKD